MEPTKDDSGQVIYWPDYVIRNTPDGYIAFDSFGNPAPLEVLHQALANASKALV